MCFTGLSLERSGGNSRFHLRKSVCLSVGLLVCPLFFDVEMYGVLVHLVCKKTFLVVTACTTSRTIRLDESRRYSVRKCVPCVLYWEGVRYGYSTFVCNVLGSLFTIGQEVREKRYLDSGSNPKTVFCFGASFDRLSSDGNTVFYYWCVLHPPFFPGFVENEAT